MTMVTVLTVVGLPLAALTAVLLAVGRVERAREALVARQIGVTDAIHRELGAVVAPLVKRRLGRGWRVEIAVPFESPPIVGRVGAIAHAAMLAFGPEETIEVALTTQEPRTEPIAWSRPGARRGRSWASPSAAG